MVSAETSLRILLKLCPARRLTNHCCTAGTEGPRSAALRAGRFVAASVVASLSAAAALAAAAPPDLRCVHGRTPSADWAMGEGEAG